MSLKIPEDLRFKFKAICARRKKTMMEVGHDLISEFVAREEQAEKRHE